MSVPISQIFPSSLPPVRCLHVCSLLLCLYSYCYLFAVGFFFFFFAVFVVQSLGHVDSLWPPVLHMVAQIHVRWVSDSIQSSLFSFCLQPFQESRSFPMSQFVTSAGQSIRASATASFLPVNIQDWFSLGWTGWISLKSKGLSRVLQHNGSKASILWRSAFFIVQLSHPYMTTGKF